MQHQRTSQHQQTSITAQLRIMICVCQSLNWALIGLILRECSNLDAFCYTIDTRPCYSSMLRCCQLILCFQGDGTGVMSIYDGHFPDENFIAQHTGPGLLSMANSGRDQNGCQFFMTCSETPHLNGKHVVFGRVIEDGLRIVRKIEHVQTDREKKPRLAVQIAQCGEM